MADRTEVSVGPQYECELTAGREEIARVLDGVVDGILTGTIQLGAGMSAVSVGVPDEVSLEIEIEGDEEEVDLELELAWPALGEDSTDTSMESRPRGASKEATLMSAAGGSESLAGFEIFRDRGEEWRWRLRHRNGNIIAISGEGYPRKHNAKKGLRSVIGNSSDRDNGTLHRLMHPFNHTQAVDSSSLRGPFGTVSPSAVRRNLIELAILSPTLALVAGVLGA